jgi:hypothetical protein
MKGFGGLTTTCDFRLSPVTNSSSSDRKVLHTLPGSDSGEQPLIVDKDILFLNDE